MTDIPKYEHSTNLIGISTAYLASLEFNENPRPLHISGTRTTAASLFAELPKLETLEDCGTFFQDYMTVIFGYEEEQRLVDRHGRRRYCNSYLRLIQNWGMDSNNAQAAVLKGWVESRFGLFPNFHKQRLDNFMDGAWMDYLEAKMNSRYHNNCIYMQLDLLYEFCQWIVERFHYPASSHKVLYRGVNDLEQMTISRQDGNRQARLRLNNVVSFTDRRSIASEFGAYILEVKVPMVKLLFFNELLPHHTLHGEAEYLVIGGDYLVNVLR